MSAATATAAPELATRYKTRETWLEAAIAGLTRELFKPLGVILPTVRVSVGWPGGRSKGNVIGECWYGTMTADNVPQVFISPTLDDAARVLDVLAHELVHAATGPGVGHKGEFTRIAKGIGLTGKMTATVASPELAAKLAALALRLGRYPHAAISANAEAAHPKQTTRMLKCACTNDGCPTFDSGKGEGYVVRTTAKWLESFGTPSCPACYEPLTFRS